MRKLLTLSAVALYAASAFSQVQGTEEIKSKLKEIDSEIKRVETLENEGNKSDVLKRQKEMLLESQAKYKKLLREVQSNEKKSDTTISTGEVPEKKLPTSVRKDMAKLETYKDESLPLEHRYELILKEITNIYELNTKIQDDPQANSEAMKKLREENGVKLKELEELKVSYELKLREVEQEELSEMKKSGVRLGVMFDAYYQWDFNRPERQAGNAPELAYKNYTNRHNDITINLLELNVFKSYKNLDFYADIDFGEMADQNKPHSDDPVSHHVGQAFLRYTFKNSNNLAFTAGKFYTHFGYEVAKNIENRTYSRPFYYTLVCPFWHEGISVTQSGLGNFGYGLYVYDRTDNRVDNNNGKTLGFQLNYSSEKVSGAYNFVSGAESRDDGSASAEGDVKQMHELILTYNLNERLALVADLVVGKNEGFNSDSGKPYELTSWVGYVDYKITPRDSLNFRYEAFHDLTSESATTNLFTTAANPNVKPPKIDSYTLTNRYQIGNGSEIRAEYRLDRATQELFPSENDNFKKTQNTIAVGWLYSI